MSHITFNGSSQVYQDATDQSPTRSRKSVIDMNITQIEYRGNAQTRLRWNKELTELFEEKVAGLIKNGTQVTPKALKIVLDQEKIFVDGREFHFSLAQVKSRLQKFRKGLKRQKAIEGSAQLVQKIQHPILSKPSQGLPPQLQYAILPTVTEDFPLQTQYSFAPMPTQYFPPQVQYPHVPMPTQDFQPQVQYPHAPMVTQNLPLQIQCPLVPTATQYFHLQMQYPHVPMPTQDFQPQVQYAIFSTPAQDLPAQTQYSIASMPTQYFQPQVQYPHVPTVTQDLPSVQCPHVPTVTPDLPPCDATEANVAEVNAAEEYEIEPNSFMNDAEEARRRSSSDNSGIFDDIAF